MQINNNALRSHNCNLPESTKERIAQIKELFKKARTMKEKVALAKALCSQTPA